MLSAFILSNLRVSVKFPFLTAASNSGRNQKSSYYNSITCLEVYIYKVLI